MIQTLEIGRQSFGERQVFGERMAKPTYFIDESVLTT